MISVTDLDFTQLPSEPHRIMYASELILDSEKNPKVRVWLESLTKKGVENWVKIDLHLNLLPALVGGGLIRDKTIFGNNDNESNTIVIGIDLTPGRRSANDREIVPSYIYKHAKLFSDETLPCPDGYGESLHYEVFFPPFRTPFEIPRVDKLVFPCSEIARKVFFTSSRAVNSLLLDEPPIGDLVKKLSQLNRFEESDSLLIPSGFNFGKEDFSWLVWAISGNVPLKYIQGIRSNLLRNLMINKREMIDLLPLVFNARFPYQCRVDLKVTYDRIIDKAGQNCLLVKEIIGIRPQLSPFNSIRILSSVSNAATDNLGAPRIANPYKEINKSTSLNPHLEMEKSRVGDEPSNGMTIRVVLPQDTFSTPIDFTQLTSEETLNELNRVNLKISELTLSSSRDKASVSGLIDVFQEFFGDTVKAKPVNPSSTDQNEILTQRKSLIEQQYESFEKLISDISSIKGISMLFNDKKKPRIKEYKFADINNWAKRTSSERGNELRSAWMIGVEYLNTLFLVIETEAFSDEIFVSSTLVAKGEDQDFLYQNYLLLLKAMALNKGSYKGLQKEQVELLSGFSLTTINHFYTSDEKQEAKDGEEKVKRKITVIPAANRAKNLIVAFKRLIVSEILEQKDVIIDNKSINDL